MIEVVLVHVTPEGGQWRQGGRLLGLGKGRSRVQDLRSAYLLSADRRFSVAGLDLRNIDRVAQGNAHVVGCGPV